MSYKAPRQDIRSRQGALLSELRTTSNMAFIGMMTFALISAGASIYALFLVAEKDAREKSPREAFMESAVYAPVSAKDVEKLSSQPINALIGRGRESNITPVDSLSSCLRLSQTMNMSASCVDANGDFLMHVRNGKPYLLKSLVAPTPAP